MKADTYITVLFLTVNLCLRDAFAAISPQQRADNANNNAAYQQQDTRQIQQPPLPDQPAQQLAQPQAGVVTPPQVHQQQYAVPQQPNAAPAYQQQQQQQPYQQPQYQQQQQQQQPQYQPQNQHFAQQQPQFQPQHYEPGPGLHVDTANQNAVATADDVVVQIGAQLLSKTKDCVEDVRRLCLHGKGGQPSQVNLNNDIEVIQCLLDSEVDLVNNIALTCQHVLWVTLKTLTTDERFHQVAQQECASDLQSRNSKLNECHTMHNERGHLLSCLIENKDHIQNESCRKFLSEVEAFVFSDYRLIHDFAQQCDAEITSYRCGRIESDEQSMHSQGATVECLEDALEAYNEMRDKAHANTDGKFKSEFAAMTPIGQSCEAQIMRTVEFQAEDYHLDRPLYFACKNDREQFCANTEAGEGKILNCLLLHIAEKTMSELCKEKLVHRRQLIERDFKADHALIKMCAKELKQYQCDLNPKSVAPTHNHPLLPVSHIIMCLENAARMGHPVDGKCQRVVIDQRKILMLHFNMTPEIGVHCAREMTHCQTTLAQQGQGAQKAEQQMLHCLMGVVEQQQGSVQQQQGAGSQNDQQCLRALQDLITVANPMQDIRIDRVLQHACQPVITSACAQVPENTSLVVTCLIDHIRAPQMLPECQKRLYELIWFAVRDFRLTGALFDKCHKDAVDLCHAPKDWNSENGVADVERGPLIFTCLYRHAYHVEETAHVGELSTECASEVRAELERRSKDIKMMPEVMGSCSSDLAKHCISGPGMERPAHDTDGLMSCLQVNLKVLQPECARTISSLTQIQFKAPHTNTDLEQNCGIEMQKLCSGALGSDEQLLDCLIDAKTSKDMSPQCSQQVTKMQLIQLVNIKFSPQFWMACQEDISDHCKNLKEKPDILVCLHDVAVKSIETKSPLLTQRCAHRVNIEMFRQNENVQFDPQVQEACDHDAKKFCQGVQPGEGRVTECLRANFQKLSQVCQQVLFKRERDQAQDRQIDYALMTNCKVAIKDHCAGATQSHDSEDLWTCLKQAKAAGAIRDRHCIETVLERQIEESRDYRLNPVLARQCQEDIPKFCYEAFSEVDNAHHQQLSLDADDYNRHPQQQKQQNDNKRRLSNDERDREHLNRASATHEAQGQLEGRVLHCLKTRLRTHKDSLSKGCADVVSEVRREEAEDYRLDAYLATRCQSDITSSSRNAFSFNIRGLMESFERPLTLRHNSSVKQCEHYPGFSVDTNLQGFLVDKLDECFFCVTQTLCGSKSVDQVYECLKQNLQRNRIKSDTCKQELARFVREGRLDVHVDTHLASTCSQDLIRFCHTVPQGDGRKMQCLLAVLSSNDVTMQLDEECATLLRERQELFDVVNNLGPDVDENGHEVSSVGELYNTVRRSRASSYLMTVLFVFIFVIFVGGLCCGRVSKGYAYRELKNR